MRPIALAALLLGTLVLPAPARAQEGFTCGLVSVTDPTGEGDVQTGEVDGGPITATSTDPNAPSADPTASMTLRCTVQVGATGHTHAGPDAASASASGTGFVVLPPTQVSFVAPEGTDTWLCTEVTVNGTVSYWDDVNGTFSSSSSVGCALVISQEIEDPPGPPLPWAGVVTIQNGSATSVPPPGWTCDQTGFFPVEVTCTPSLLDIPGDCPAMAVLAAAASGQVRGEVACDSVSVSTRLVSGFHADANFGDLGRSIRSVRCRAHSAVANYVVICAG